MINACLYMVREILAILYITQKLTVLSGQLVSQRECTTILFHFEQYTLLIKTLTNGRTNRRTDKQRISRS